MRILTICYEYPPVGGGGAVVCREIAQALVAAGHDVSVVTSRMAGLPAFASDAGVRVYRASSWRRRRYHATTPELASELVPAFNKAMRLVSEQAFDVVHCHFVVPSGLVARQVWMRTRTPYVLTAHGSDIPGYNDARFRLTHRVIAPVWRRVIRDAAALTTPSHFLEGLIRRYLDVPVRVIPNAFAPVSSPDLPRRDRLLMVSRMLERKGVQHFIRALKGLPPGWEAVVAGDGPYLDTAKRIAADAGVAVSFLGHVAREDLPALYRSAKVFVFPSHQENFPMVLLEAMAAGCAVVCSTAPGCREVVGEAAVLVEPGNVDRLHASLAMLIRDPAAVEGLRRRGLERVTTFSPERIARQYEELLQHSSTTPSERVVAPIEVASDAA